MIIPCIVDSHCDSIQPAAEGKQPLVNPYNYSQKYPQLQFVAFFCGWPKEDARASYERAHRYLEALRASVADESQNLALVKSYADIEAAFAAGKHAALFSMEGATGLCGSVEILREFYEAGLRVTGLAWLSNDLAKSNRVIYELPLSRHDLLPVSHHTFFEAQGQDPRYSGQRQSRILIFPLRPTKRHLFRRKRRSHLLLA